MKRTLLFSLFATVAVAASTVAFVHAQGAATAKPAPAATAKPGTGRLIEIAAHDADATGEILFSVASIEAKPGEALRVKITHVGQMPKMASSHNFVLLKIGTDVAPFLTQALAGGFKNNYLPAQSDAILASTPLAGVGESFEVSFKAPAVRGSYPFICTFPGHYAAGMKGVLIVK
jgi:azurin